MLVWQMPQRIADLPRAARNAGNFCYLSVTRNTAFGYVTDYVPDTVHTCNSVHRCASGLKAVLHLLLNPPLYL